MSEKIPGLGTRGSIGFFGVDAWGHVERFGMGAHGQRVGIFGYTHEERAAESHRRKHRLLRVQREQIRHLIPHVLAHANATKPDLGVVDPTRFGRRLLELHGVAPGREYARFHLGGV